VRLAEIQVETQVDDSGDDKDSDDAGDSGVEAVTAHLSLGSNLGDRRENLDKALDYLSQKTRLTKVSSVYDTEAVGNAEQPRFLNLVCQISTRLAPVELLMLVKGIERKLGRQPGKTNTPRPIDIDILFYDNEAVNSLELIIPHPRLTERAFVLAPLTEIAPELVHPANGKTAKELLGELEKGVQGVFKLENN
jgi:2-amino-4-hydroxy-6-hydroxymethyldihydropteridine diphosphokinase